MLLRLNCYQTWDNYFKANFGMSKLHSSYCYDCNAHVSLEASEIFLRSKVTGMCKMTYHCLYSCFTSDSLPIVIILCISPGSSIWGSQSILQTFVNQTAPTLESCIALAVLSFFLPPLHSNAPQLPHLSSPERMQLILVTKWSSSGRLLNKAGPWIIANLCIISH